MKHSPDKFTFKETHKEKEVAKEHKDAKENPDKLKHEKENKDQQKEKNEKHEKHEKHEGIDKQLAKEHGKSEFEVPPINIPDPGPEETAAIAAAHAMTVPHPTSVKLTDKAVFTEKFTKVEYEKHHKLEKLEIFEKHPKAEKYEHEVFYPQFPVQPDPEARLAALEAAVAQLAHFIPQTLRPDLSKGALKQEPAAPAQPAEAEAAKEPEKGKK